VSNRIWRVLAGVDAEDEAPERVPAGDVVASVRDVAVVLGDTLILDGIDLDVRAGELLVLVGPNGAGKSTLLAVVSGDLAPTDGHVELCRRPEPDWGPVDGARRRAVLTQAVDVAFPFTVDEIVRMGRTPWERTGEEEHDEEVVDHAIGSADVDHLRGRRFPSLSGGERSRVAFARVLAQTTQLVLLDEPTAALDIHHQELVMRRARALADEGNAVLAVLHDLGLAAAYAHRVAVLGDHTIQAVGTPAEVLTAELLSRVYQHDIEVFPHPATGSLVILPTR